MLKQQEEEHLGVEDIMKKIDEECALELTAKMHEEEHDNEL